MLYVTGYARNTYSSLHFKICAKIVYKMCFPEKSLTFRVESYKQCYSEWLIIARLCETILPNSCIRISKIASQSLAMTFIYNKSKKAEIIILLNLFTLTKKVIDFPMTFRVNAF
jgi:hypothetical protein